MSDTPKVVVRPAPRRAPFRARSKLGTMRIYRNYPADPYDITLFKAEAGKITRWILPLCAITMLITGTISMILTQLLFNTPIPPRPDEEDEAAGQGGESLYFQGSLVVQFSNSLGQACCLLIYLIDSWLVARGRKSKGGLFDLLGDSHFPGGRNENRRRAASDAGSEARSVRISKDAPGRIDREGLCVTGQENGGQEAPATAYIVSALADFTSSIALIMALEVSKAYAVQIYRNTAVLMCAALSVGVLRRDLRVFHWVGIFGITLGLICLAVGALWRQTGQVDPGLTGPVLTLISCFIQVIQLIYEERLMYKYKLASPYRGVGWTGVWEILITIVAIVFAHYSGFESVAVNWYHLRTSGRVRCLLSIFTVSAGIYMSCGLVVTKFGAAILTSVIAATRQIPIWVVEVSLKWVPFRWLSMAGLVLCVIGHLFYNNVWPSRLCCPWYRAHGKREVRLRCYIRREDQETIIGSDCSQTSFYDSMDSDNDNDDGYSSDDTCGGGSALNLTVRDDFEIADNIVRNAVITTRHPGYGGLSDDTAWIYVKRRSEPLEDCDSPAGWSEQEATSEEITEANRILARIRAQTPTSEEFIDINS